jgi:N-acetylglucosaminyldiphosphoundecaprenol N-acetyl-beta-D-mannosaminyltransferase
VLKGEYGIKRVTGRNGYFSENDEEDIVKEINNSHVEILFLGMSSPKKDAFLARWKDKLKVRVVVHCGGMIDIISGKTKLYPKWVKDFCLAAIYRFIQEPIRLRRDIANAAKSFFLILKILFKVKILRRDYYFPKSLKS